MKLSVFSKFLAKIEISQSKHRLRDFCDDVITYDVTKLVSKDVFTNKEQLHQSF